MIPNTVLTATIFTILLLLIKIGYVIEDNKRAWLMVGCVITSLISGIFWGLSLFGTIWYGQVLSYVLGVAFGIICTPHNRIKTSDNGDIVGKTGVVVEIIEDRVFPYDYRGKLDNGEDIIFSSKEELNIGDKFEIKEISDKIWVWKKE